MGRGINVLLVKPGEQGKMISMNNDIETMKEIVGGLLQVMQPFDNKRIALVCNQNPTLIGAKPNRVLLNGSGSDRCALVEGTFFLCRIAKDGRSLISLSGEDVKEVGQLYLETYHEFIKSGENISLQVHQVA